MDNGKWAGFLSRISVPPFVHCHFSYILPCFWTLSSSNIGSKEKWRQSQFTISACKTIEP